MCEPEASGWDWAPPVKTAAVFLAAAAALAALGEVARVWVPVALMAGGVAALTAGAVWGLHARFTVVLCEADPVFKLERESLNSACVNARELESRATLPAVAAPSERQARLGVGVRPLAPGVVLKATGEEVTLNEESAMPRLRQTRDPAAYLLVPKEVTGVVLGVREEKVVRP
jgi:hypothetical protein